MSSLRAAIVLGGATLVAAAAAACGGGNAQHPDTNMGTASATSTASSTAPTTTSTATSTELPAMPATLTPPAKPWADMTKEERGKHMSAVVTPAMKGLFQAYDAKDFEKFNCMTCHGDNAKEVGFKMPNKLPALPKPMSPEWEAMTKKDAHVVEFMAKRVVPAMAKTLGMEPYNPQTNSGFGCFGCHPHQ